MPVVANPIAATLGLGQVFGFTTQSATGFVVGYLRDCFGRLFFHLHSVDRQKSMAQFIHHVWDHDLYIMFVRFSPVIL